MARTAAAGSNSPSKTVIRMQSQAKLINDSPPHYHLASTKGFPQTLVKMPAAVLRVTVINKHDLLKSILSNVLFCGSCHTLELVRNATGVSPQP